MTILIIGATGYIGRYLAEHLLENDHKVLVTSRDTARAQNLLGKRFEYIQWDGESAEQLTPHLEHVDGIINLAGENIAGGRWTAKRKARFYNSRVKTGNSLSQAILGCANKPEVLLQASASGIYGPNAENPYGEKRAPGEGYLAQLCVQWENSVKALEETPVRVVYIRTGPILGPYSPFLVNMVLPFRFGMGVVLGTGNQWLPWIHIQDEIGAIRFLIEQPSAKGPFNLSAPEPVTMRQLVRTIGKIRKQPSWLKISPFLLKMALGQMAEETILSSQDVLPEALMDAGYIFQFNDVEDALRHLLRK